MKLFAPMFSFLLILSCTSSKNVEPVRANEDSNRMIDHSSAPVSSDSGSSLGGQTPSYNEAKPEQASSPNITLASSSTGWTSGGGGVFGNQSNPWFLDNQSKISYCILLDQENFSSEHISQKDWAQRIQSGFEFWTKEFDYANTSLANDLLNKYREDAALLFDLTKIEFILVDTCGQDTDIIFQLGVLSDLQAQFIAKEFGQVIASAVRTEYDPITLKGRGFVYFSPELGPRVPKVKDLRSGRWDTSSRIFEKVLIHELGHVLGIRHLAQSIMDDEYVDKLVTDTHRSNNSDPSYESFFNFLGQKTFVSCKMPFTSGSWPSDLTWEKIWQLLGLKAEHECAEFVLSPKDWNLEIYEFQWGDPSSGVPGKRGQLVARSSFFYSLQCNAIEYRESTLTINLDDTQKVYQTTRQRLYGPFLMNGISCFLPVGLITESLIDSSEQILFKEFRHIKIERSKLYLVNPESFPGAGDGFDLNVAPYDTAHPTLML